MIDELMMRLARHCKARRGSQSDLARMLGVSRQHVSKWMAGTTRPNADNALKIKHWLERQSG